MQPSGASGYHVPVNRILLRILTAVQLTRLTIAFGAISDIWFAILFTRAVAADSSTALTDLATPWALLVGSVVAVGLFAYGAALNDVLDVRHDATFSPNRPIPAGRIRVGQAIVLTVGSLIVAVLASAAFGTWAVCLTLLTAAGLLFYNAAGRFIPPVGLITLGLVHAGHMMIPNHHLSFMLPVWLVMTHALVISAAVHAFESKRPRLTRRSLIVTGLGWAFWTIVILGHGLVTYGTLWPVETSPLRLVYPLSAALMFVVVVRWKTAGVAPTVAAEKLKRYGAMWQSLYGAAWLVAAGLLFEAGVIFALAGFGFIAMTLIKELLGQTARPVGYR